MIDYLDLLKKSENGGGAYLQNLQNLETGGFDGFVGTTSPHSENHAGGFVGFDGDTDPRFQKSQTSQIDPEPILATAYTPAGDLVMVPATSAAHAAWIERMNPPPVPVPIVRCCDCQRASITNGIAACGAGVDSGLPIAGFWATDQHPCGSYWGIEAEVRS